MKTKINFNKGMHDAYTGMTIPDHTQETLEHYFLNGWEPGGFVTSMLAMDMERALSTADTANRQRMWAIGRWIIDNAPSGSWGSYELVQAWLHDEGGRRTAYAKEIEQLFIMTTLKEGVE